MRNPLQLVLDFLSPSVEPAPLRQAPPLTPSSVAIELPQPPQVGKGHVALNHPRANRETQLQGLRVAYLFQRVRRKSIGFVVGPDGLEVRAPKWVTLKEVEMGLQERGEWVLRKWSEIQARQKNIRQIEWADGACLDYLGASIRLRLSPDVGRSCLLYTSDAADE